MHTLTYKPGIRVKLLIMLLSLSLLPVLVLALRPYIHWTVILIVLIIGAVWHLAKSLSQPIVSLAAAADRLASGDLSQTVAVPTQDELRQLAEALNRIAASLKRSQETVQVCRADLEAKSRELTQASAQLARASQYKSEFLASLNHELRTPLNAVIGFSDLLREQTHGPLNATQLQYVQTILAGSERLLRLVNDMLDFSQSEAGRVQLYPERLLLAHVLEEITPVIGGLAGKKNITVEMPGPALNLMMVADRTRLKQVMCHLLSNAIKFTPPGGCIRVRAHQDGPNLCVAVSDTGIGIKPEDRERIFDGFVQVDGSYTRPFGGTGLGLALTKRLVEMHGGTIWVTSEVGQGTTFTFTIPWASDLHGAAPPSLGVN